MISSIFPLPLVKSADIFHVKYKPLSPSSSLVLRDAPSPRSTSSYRFSSFYPLPAYPPPVRSQRLLFLPLSSFCGVFIERGFQCVEGHLVIWPLTFYEEYDAFHPDSSSALVLPPFPHLSWRTQPFHPCTTPSPMPSPFLGLHLSLFPSPVFPFFSTLLSNSLFVLLDISLLYLSLFFFFLSLLHVDGIGSSNSRVCPGQLPFSCEGFSPPFFAPGTSSS